MVTGLTTQNFGRWLCAKNIVSKEQMMESSTCLLKPTFKISQLPLFVWSMQPLTNIQVSHTPLNLLRTNQFSRRPFFNSRLQKRLIIKSLLLEYLWYKREKELPIIEKQTRRKSLSHANSTLSWWIRSASSSKHVLVVDLCSLLKIKTSSYLQASTLSW